MAVKLDQIPFLRVILPFAAGIITELYFPAHYLFLYATIVSLLFLFLWNWRYRINYSTRWIYGSLLSAFMFTSGYAVTLLRTPTENKLYAGNLIGEAKDTLVVSIVSIPQEKEKTYKATGELTSIIKNGKQLKTTGKALFYFHKDSISENIKYGDVLLVYSQLKPIDAPANPDEFNYKYFLQMHGINYFCYVSPTHYSFIGTNGTNRLLSFANNCRKKLSGLLQQKIGGSEADIASAILLGYRDELSQADIQNFTNSGVIHVICVAGLHVGILFLLLNYIIVFPSKFKYHKPASMFIILLLLWGYAIFTGLATPVLRATIMFSLLTIGRFYRKHNHPLNTLAVSAFLLLLFSPFSIADTGFQLSYLAVSGIIILYEPLLSLSMPRNMLLRKIWEIICVSVSAQVAVLPLSLLYFHQFPDYFIISNILIVPLLALVIYTGILFFITSPVPIISIAVSWILKKWLQLIHIIVYGISHLPYSIIKGISISPFETILLFLFLSLIITFLFLRKSKQLVAGTCVLALFIGIRVIEKTIHLNQQILAVYDIPGKSAIIFISGEHSVMPYSEVDSNDVAWHIQDNWWKLGIKDNHSVQKDTDAVMLSGRLMMQQQFVQFNTYKIALIRQNSDLPSLTNKITLHSIIISSGYNLTMRSLTNVFNVETIIFDSSVPDYKLKNWEAECEQLHLHYYSVKTLGAYIEKC